MLNNVWHLGQKAAACSVISRQKFAHSHAISRAFAVASALGVCSGMKQYMRWLESQEGRKRSVARCKMCTFAAAFLNDPLRPWLSHMHAAQQVDTTNS